MERKQSDIRHLASIAAFLYHLCLVVVVGTTEWENCIKVRGEKRSGENKKSNREEKREHAKSDRHFLYAHC